MTTRKRLLLSAPLLAVLVCMVLIALAMLPAKPGVTKANFDRIEIGMTKEEVDSFFGPPPMAPIRTPNAPGGETVWLWRSHHVDVEINFRDSRVTEGGKVVGGKVVTKTWEGREESLTEKIRRWLHN